MFCPNCGAEYQQGIDECYDCRVPLVEQPPAETTGEDLETVYRTADASLLPVIKSVLAAAGIPCLVQGDEGSALFPLGSVGGSADDRDLGAVVKVPKSRAAEARQLLEEEERV